MPHNQHTQKELQAIATKLNIPATAVRNGNEEEVALWIKHLRDEDDGDGFCKVMEVLLTGGSTATVYQKEDCSTLLVVAYCGIGNTAMAHIASDLETWYVQELALNMAKEDIYEDNGFKSWEEYLAANKKDKEELAAAKAMKNK